MKKNKAIAKKFAVELDLMSAAMGDIKADEDAAQVVNEQISLNNRLKEYLQEIYTEEY